MSHRRSALEPSIPSVGMPRILDLCLSSMFWMKDCLSRWSLGRWIFPLLCLLSLASCGERSGVSSASIGSGSTPTAFSLYHLILFVGIILTVALLIVVISLIYLGRVRCRNHLALQRILALRETFFTHITHELRTPLTLILGLSHDLQKPEVEEEVRDKAQVIERQGKGLLHLINQLLDISKVESAFGEPDWCNGDITAYFMMLVESWREYARHQGVELQFFVQEPVVMDFVPDYMSKVMNNLLSNAFKFTPQSGRVCLSMHRSGDQLLVDLSDTGRGMDEETIQCIFEPFFYQAKSETRSLGTGVGMVLVKQIMTTIGGRITVESKEGKGTTFHLTMPIHHRAKRQISPAEVEMTPQLPDSSANAVDSEKIDSEQRLLIIEDNRDIAAYIASQFSSQYEISYAYDGREGLMKALELVPNLIITDLMMPSMDGLELCRHIRSNEIINHIPIIVVTAKISEEERIAGIEAGADAYLAKPFSGDELRTRVEKLLAGRRMLQEKFLAMAVKGKEREKPLEEKDADLRPDTDTCQEEDLRFLNKVSDFVYMQLSRNKEVSVATIAFSMCMSSRQLHRKIHALTGYPPSGYIQRLKIKKACNLLDKDTMISFVEVADQCGFDTYPNFVRAFKNVRGMTPTDYRKKTLHPDYDKQV